MIRFTLRINNNINSMLDKLKTKLGLSKNRIINLAIKEFLDKNEI
ncbi:ribbon-helix-helix domain-containing protein [Gemella sp. ND 6198]|nr:ribbon-helix-helix domain-containing protein [Gemella sp. ND 6198]